MAQQVDNIIQRAIEIRLEIARLKEEEKIIKETIHSIMSQTRQNTLVTDNYVCVRKIRQRRDLFKRYIPREIWDRYSRTIEYPVLLFSNR
jgi:hypothetical protein